MRARIDKYAKRIGMSLVFGALMAVVMAVLLWPIWQIGIILGAILVPFFVWFDAELDKPSGHDY
jgi:hypothetical protein